MNPLGIFFHPRQTINETIENPNMIVAIMLVLLPTLVGYLGLINFGFQADQFVFLLALISEIVFWILTALVIAILVYIVKRESLRQKFAGILAALSLLKVVGLVLTFLIISMPLILPPSLTKDFEQMQKGNLSNAEFIANFNSEIAKNPNAINEGALYVMIVFSIILLIYSLWLYYLIISHLMNSTKLKTLLVWIIIIIIVAIFVY